MTKSVRGLHLRNLSYGQVNSLNPIYRNQSNYDPFPLAGKMVMGTARDFNVNAFLLIIQSEVTRAGSGLKHGYLRIAGYFIQIATPRICLPSLLKSYCLPLYYGLESFDMTRSEMNKLNVPIMRAFNKIFHVFDKNSVQLCIYYCGVLSSPFELI